MQFPDPVDHLVASAGFLVHQWGQPLTHADDSGGGHTYYVAMRAEIGEPTQRVL